MRVIDHNRVGLYVHVPFCVKKCPYCSFYSEQINSYDAAEVISAIINEIQSYHAADAATIYIGGGSPSCLAINDLLRLVEEAQNVFPRAEEITVEVNPLQVDGGLLKSLYKSGVNRLSMGVQSFDDKELKFLSRGHSGEDIARVIGEGRDAGFENISIDLMFAVPGSSLDSWQSSLAAATALGVEHISAYSLTYEKNTPMTEKRDSGKLKAVDEEIDRAMYEMAIDQLAAAGYGQYEISNFARAGFECKHNMGYWQNKPYIGVGPAAGSYFEGKRTMNVAEIGKYVAAIELEKSPVCQVIEPSVEEIACETMVLGLRMIEGVELSEFEQRMGFDAVELFAGVIESNRGAGLIEDANGRLRLTRKALPIADTVLCDFAGV